jgi:hypothetical protein
MTLAFENVRLQELFVVTEQNKPFFDDFVGFLNFEGYELLYNFIMEANELKGKEVIIRYFKRPLPFGLFLYDGVARPYPADKAKWLLLAWIFRDAPIQRLGPMLKTVAGSSLVEKKATLLNQIRMHINQFLIDPERWGWVAISEVIVDRLEGSRRAIKGTLFEAIVRRLLAEIFLNAQIELSISDTEIRLEGETYDVVVRGPNKQILMPVKTRETMGGGHALLFTRDIHKSITAAHNAGLECVPIIIAESWSGDITSLDCKVFVHIDKNPNQIKEVEPLLRQKLMEFLPIFEAIAS